MRVRYADFLAGCHREEKLRLCRRLLGVVEGAEGTEEDEDAEEDGFEGGDEETPDGNADFDRASDVDDRAPRERFPVTCPRCGRSNMTCLGRYDASNTARLIAERRAFWELVHTVASIFDDLPFA